MSRMLTSNHFNVEQLEFDGAVRYHGDNKVYIGFAIINECYMMFGLSVEEKISILSHSFHNHPSTYCPLCVGEDKHLYEFVRIHHNELFQLLINHPAVRLHWLLINPSDYEE